MIISGLAKKKSWLLTLLHTCSVPKDKDQWALGKWTRCKNSTNSLHFPNFINPFVPNASFLYPLKISENLRVF